MSDKMALYVRIVKSLALVFPSNKSLLDKSVLTITEAPLEGCTTSGNFLSKADHIIDYRPVPVSPLALKLFSIRHFFRDLDGTHVSLLSPPRDRGRSCFLFFEE